MKCILPYSNCVYCLADKICSDGLERPNKKEAKCYRVSGKKKMLRSARLQTDLELYKPLQVNVSVMRGLVTPTMIIRIEKLKVAFLQYRKGVWCLMVRDDMNYTPMANNELDAVEATLKHLGYYE